ncbi:hypothetical protein LUX57_51515 [Actinomadura madurae]|nr:hypothetical protein [Actinomadura madurae]MCP9972491.1 hypothetical protein [Actinomadura madurae]
MLDFTEPSHSGLSRSCPYVASRARASIGSPSAVPVPWASTASTSDVDSRASARASRITRSCDGPFGAVSPLDAPSWFTAEPRTTPRIRRPLCRASDSRSSSSTPTPSPQAAPSAASANALHRPSAASPRCRPNSTNASGDAITVTPPASASADSPERSDRTARCNATSDDEHAVSTVNAGPCRPSAYATRPDTTLPELPVLKNPPVSSPVARTRGP